MKQQGFVLVATLWILAILAIGASHFAQRVERAINLAQQNQASVQTLIDMGDSRAEILFRLATTPMSIHGLGPTPHSAVALDDTPYQASGDVIIRLQDNRGLLNLNSTGDERLYRLFSLLGVPSDRHGRLIDTLRDYTDFDNLKRLNGAEREEYERLGPPPPANQLLITPNETRRIIGWSDVEALWKNDALSRLCTTGTATGLNPNTASWEVLATLPGVTNAIAEEMTRLREQSPLVSTSHIAQLTGRSLEELLFVIMPFPGNSIRITQTSSRVQWGLEYNVSLTPTDERAPWSIDYFQRIQTLPDKDKHAPPLPPLVSAAPPPLPAFLSNP